MRRPDDIGYDNRLQPVLGYIGEEIGDRRIFEKPKIRRGALDRPFPFAARIGDATFANRLHGLDTFVVISPDAQREAPSRDILLRGLVIGRDEALRLWPACSALLQDGNRQNRFGDRRRKRELEFRFGAGQFHGLIAVAQTVKAPGKGDAGPCSRRVQFMRITALPRREAR